MYWYIAGGVASAVAVWYLKRRFPQKKKYYEAALVVAVSFWVAVVLGQMDQAALQEERIMKNEPGQGAKEQEYLVDAEGVLEGYSLDVQVSERKLTEAQCQEYFEKAKEELECVAKGDNPSLDEVAEALYLPDTLQDGAVEVGYQFSDYDVFLPDGTFKVELEKAVMVEITAELCCQERTCLYSFLVRAVPKKKSQQEGFVDQIRKVLIEENEKEGSAYLVLPQEVDGKGISWRQKAENRSVKILFLGIVGAVGVLMSEKEAKKRRETERQQQMLRDYPEIVSKLSLLLGAGMNITLAWEKIAMAYRKKREGQEMECRYAYEEMLGTLYEMQEGVGELQALENFGERCHLSVYRKLASLIVQNIRKGAKGMQRLLEEEEWEAFEQQKARARKAGEEAGTKLMLPMVMMLIIVLVILMVPAGMTLHL